MSDKPQRLTNKEQKFVDGVAKGLGYGVAAVAAGYSMRSARTLAARLLKKVHINEALDKRREYFRSIADVEVKDIIGAQAEMAFASIEDALDENGYLDFAKAKLNGSAKLIRKISRVHTKYGETVAVEFYSRADALDKLSNILGLYQQARPNTETIEKAITAYREWIQDNPNASAEESQVWMQRFATLAQVPADQFARKADIEIPTLQ